MAELLILDGPPALSRFALDKLRAQMPASITGLYAEFVHLLAVDAALGPEERARAEALLTYGPRNDLPRRLGEPIGVVLPRLGTISPWSSKATEIFRICDLESVSRVERGVRWYLEGKGDTEAVLSLVHDRMTERVIRAGGRAEEGVETGFSSVFELLEPRPLSRVELLRGGKGALTAANVDLGLALSDDEIDYLLRAYLDWIATRRTSS